MGIQSIVVVDDERDLLTVMAAMLEKHGYQVHGFDDPVRALAHVDDCKECCILVSDIRMPSMNGFQLVKAAKKRRPDMKVVLMTAFEINKKEWQETLPSTEVDQFLTKPFSMSKLVEAVEKCVPPVH